MPEIMGQLRTLILWVVLSTTLANAQCPTGAALVLLRIPARSLTLLLVALRVRILCPFPYH